MDSRISPNALAFTLISKVDSPNGARAPVTAFSFRDAKIRPPSFTQFLLGCEVEHNKHKLFAARTFTELTSVDVWLMSQGHCIHFSDSPTILLWLN